jgi:hypothetical protein
MTYPGIENSPAAVAANPDRVAVEERRRERDEEYSKYVAVQDIPWGNVPAYFAGERVATSSVEEYGWLDLGYVKPVEQEQPAEESASEPTTAQKVMTSHPAAKAAKNKDEEAK